MGIEESNPKCSLLSAKNVESTPSKSVKKYNKTNKELSEAQASEFSGGSKAEKQWETLKDGSSQPTKISSKRTHGSKDQSNNGSACRRKILGQENMDGTETQDEENLLNSHAKTNLKNRNHFLFSNTHINEIISPLANGNSKK